MREGVTEGGGEIGGDPGRRIVFHRIPGYIDFSYFDPRQDLAGQNTHKTNDIQGMLFTRAQLMNVFADHFLPSSNGRLNVGKFLCEGNRGLFFFLERSRKYLIYGNFTGDRHMFSHGR